MLPIVTPDEMHAIDRAAPEPVDVLIGRAGSAVARVAIEMLGGAYGRRVVIVEGKGNNGNDGRDAARRLRRQGVRTIELDAATAPASLPPCDLVIDAAYGTGFRGTWIAPAASSGTPVLAVDIPSGVDGLTGAVDDASRVQRADRTITFAALKPGLLLEPGRSLAGRVTVADIGLDVSSARAQLVTLDDVAARWPARPSGSHKWKAAVWAIAGSPGMAGAAALVAGGAQRAGAGYVRLSSPGGLGAAEPIVPVEVVRVDLPADGWSSTVLERADDLDRFGALVIGNGLGTSDATAAEIRAVVTFAAATSIAIVVDADGLTALAALAATSASMHRFDRVVLTPHDGEYARLMGAAPGPDRVAAGRDLAATFGAIALLKGPATVVAHPDGRVLVSTAGDARLATAGTGDVLAGIIGALCARGLEPFEAAAAGACIHGSAGALGWSDGLVAGDLIEHLPAVLATFSPPAPTTSSSSSSSSFVPTGVPDVVA